MHKFLCSIERFQAPKGGEYKNMTMLSVLGDYPEDIGSRLLQSYFENVWPIYEVIHWNISEGRKLSTIW